MTYWVLIREYSKSFTGPYDSVEEARKAAERHTQNHGTRTTVVSNVAECWPLPREVRWDDA